jgi:hypothetical protein
MVQEGYIGAVREIKNYAVLLSLWAGAHEGPSPRVVCDRCSEGWRICCSH